MNAETNPKARGTIIKVPDASPGLLFVTGQQKSFTLEGVWKSPVAPAVNQIVDVDLDGAGAITGLTVVDAQQMNRERFNQVSGAAQEKGKEAAIEAAKMAQQGIGVLAARMGVIALGALVLFWIVWFSAPAYKFDLGMGVGQTFTFWDFLGFGISDSTAVWVGGAPDTPTHGIFSLAALLAIAAPLAAPFLKDVRAKYLYAAPLACVIVGSIAVRSSISREAGPSSADFMSGLSMTTGTYLLILLGVVLAAQAVMKPSTPA
jgi:hypothetical protein